jgi:hypothetical protein
LNIIIFQCDLHAHNALFPSSLELRNSIVGEATLLSAHEMSLHHFGSQKGTREFNSAWASEALGDVAITQ